MRRVLVFVVALAEMSRRVPPLLRQREPSLLSPARVPLPPEPSWRVSLPGRTC